MECFQYLGVDVTVNEIMGAEVWHEIKLIIQGMTLSESGVLRA